jgi:Mg2+/Co2+ transporter CorB
LDTTHTRLLLGALIALIFISAFFSGSETAMVALNRYRLRHLARQGHKGARRVEALQNRMDKLLSTVLVGNNFANIYAATLATLLAISWFGETGAAFAPLVLSIVVLIFAEVTPKVFAASHPERFALPASLLLTPLMWLLTPLNWLINGISNLVLRLLGIKSGKGNNDSLSPEELRTVVNEAGGLVPEKHRKMLLNILDLENITVEDIMIPRNEVVGIDMEDSMEEILSLLRAAPHTRLPVFQGDPNNILGMLHLRRTAHLLRHEEIRKDDITSLMTKPYFVPEGTPLNKQLIHFQNARRRIGIVVDEYGEVLGLITLEDILEEIVGEFTTNLTMTHDDIQPQPDGSYLIDGGMHLRDINRLLHWKLPTNGPKTLNGLILEYLRDIPESNVSLRIGNYLIDVMQLKDNTVKMARVFLASATLSPHKQRNT